MGATTTLHFLFFHVTFPLPTRELLWVTVEDRLPGQSFNLTTERWSHVLLLFHCVPDELRHTAGLHEEILRPFSELQTSFSMAVNHTLPINSPNKNF